MPAQQASRGLHNNSPAPPAAAHIWRCSSAAAPAPACPAPCASGWPCKPPPTAGMSGIAPNPISRPLGRPLGSGAVVMGLQAIMAAAGRWRPPACITNAAAALQFAYVPGREAPGAGRQLGCAVPAVPHRSTRQSSSSVSRAAAAATHLLGREAPGVGGQLGRDAHIVPHSRRPGILV